METLDPVRPAQDQCVWSRRLDWFSSAKNGDWQSEAQRSSGRTSALRLGGCGLDSRLGRGKAYKNGTNFLLLTLCVQSGTLEVGSPNDCRTDTFHILCFVKKRKTINCSSGPVDTTVVLLPAQPFAVLLASPRWPAVQSGERLKCNWVE